ncbi:MAG: division/cell wall cluster transcriptional repressor MraZ [Chloroflexota bacterium]|nr:division/cell wall cluster transcriptional repressor MraZ [Chloroflexota bacterium]
MLLGEFRCSTDAEGRLTIPSEFRAELAEGAAVTRGIDRCVVVYPAVEFQELAEKIEDRLPITNRQARAFTRLVFSGALACAVDQEGQIRLPGQLLEYADIEDEAVVVGLFSHLEIWSPRHWQRTRAESVQDGAGLAEQLDEFRL